MSDTTVILKDPIPGGEVCTLKWDNSRSIIPYYTYIDHPAFWPVYTENYGLRCKTGYKTLEAATRGHARILRRVKAELRAEAQLRGELR